MRRCAERWIEARAPGVRRLEKPVGRASALDEALGAPGTCGAPRTTSALSVASMFLRERERVAGCFCSSFGTIARCMQWHARTCRNMYSEYVYYVRCIRQLYSAVTASCAGSAQKIARSNPHSSCGTRGPGLASTTRRAPSPQQHSPAHRNSYSKSIQTTNTSPHTRVSARGVRDILYCAFVAAGWRCRSIPPAVTRARTLMAA